MNDLRLPMRFRRPAQSATLTAAALAAALLGAGCQSPPRDNMIYQRGVQMLACGSPKSAIPILSQVVAADGQDPEPRAMLALAYALDCQPELAGRIAAMVKRDPKASAVGWEHVALAVAAMTRNRPDQAADYLKMVLAEEQADSPMKASAQQWLTMDLLLIGDLKAAGAKLEAVRRDDPGHTTALLWAVLVRGRAGETADAGKDLAKAAAAILGSQRLATTRPTDFSTADPLVIGDGGIAAVAAGELERGGKFFGLLAGQGAESCDAQTWLGLLAAAAGQWEQAIGKLKAAAQDGPNRARSLAHQLLSVVAAIENRPADMIQHMLTGQRLQERYFLPTQTPPTPSPPDNVWFSHKMK